MTNHIIESPLPCMNRSLKVKGKRASTESSSASAWPLAWTVNSIKVYDAFAQNARNMVGFVSRESLETGDYQIPLTTTLLVKHVIGWQFAIGDPPCYRRVPQYTVDSSFFRDPAYRPESEKIIFAVFY